MLLGLNRGFEHYDDEVPRSPGGIAALEAERAAREVTDRALTWLHEAPGQPFFAWVHLYDAHAPYEPPEPFRSAFPGRPYEGEVATVDAEVGRLVAELARLGLDRNTIVAVVGDHGESVGEHAYWFAHGEYLYDSTLRVPLLVRSPGLVPPGTSVRGVVRLEDLAPTILDLAGAPPPAGIDGLSFAPALRTGGQPEAPGAVAVHFTDHLLIRMPVRHWFHIRRHYYQRRLADRDRLEEACRAFCDLADAYARKRLIPGYSSTP